MSLRTVVGPLQLGVWHRQDPPDQHWGCPLRERWDLRAHQQRSPALEEKLAFNGDAGGLVCRGGLGGGELGWCDGRFGAPCLGAAGGQEGRSAGAGATPASAPRARTPTAGLGVGPADDRWLVGAFSWARLGKEDHPEGARRIARNQAGRVLPAGASGPNGRGSRRDRGQARRALARRAAGTGAAAAWGSAARRIGARPGDAGAGRGHSLDLELGGGSLAGGQKAFGFLARRAARVGIGPGAPGRGGSQKQGLSRVAMTSPASWPSAGGVEGNCGAQGAPRAGGGSGAEAKALFCRSSRAHELSANRRARLAHRQWTRGIHLASRPMSFQAARPILDRAGFPPLKRTG